MSGIVGSSQNIRGSGIVAKLGTDGQVFTSAGAGVKQTYEAAAGGAWTLIKTVTASGDTVAFVDGSSDVVFDTTYNCYCIVYTAVEPATDTAEFRMNVTIDGGSNYDVAKTQFGQENWCTEAGSSGTGNNANMDLGNGTGDAPIALSIGTTSDECVSGNLFFWNPGSTTYVKMYFGESCSYHSGNCHYQYNVGGYANTASAVDGIKFVFSTGDFAAGSFSLYGLSK